jgi:tetratricopeptide (TPR) repeat protein
LRTNDETKNSVMRNLVWRGQLILSLLMVSSNSSTVAQTQTQTTKPRTIRQKIESKDSGQIKEAVETIWEQLHSTNPQDVKNAANGLDANHWLEGLIVARHYEDVERLSLDGIRTLPSDTRLVELLQSYRMRALLEMGRKDEALGAAKGLFNVCRMQSTANALQTLVECLRAARPGEEAIIDRFRQEQIAGAKTDERSTLNAQRSTSILGSIKVDGSPYEAGIRERKTNGYWSLKGTGNLLLLADKPKQARAFFEQAYKLASTNVLAEATESFARCMKAEDGTVGRANAWVLSNRP